MVYTNLISFIPLIYGNLGDTWWYFTIAFLFYWHVFFYRDHMAMRYSCAGNEGEKTC